MLNTALNKADLIYLLTQQEKLDSSMRDTHGIKKRHWLENMTKEHTIALNVEKHEFINEAYQTWKYWKKKPMNTALILEEAIDVIHFVMLILNKPTINIEKTAKETANWIMTAHPLQDRNAVKNAILVLSEIPNHPRQVLTFVLQILDYYGFDVMDILRAYKEKNTKNFERMVEGY